MGYGFSTWHKNIEHTKSFGIIGGGVFFKPAKTPFTTEDIVCFIMSPRTDLTDFKIINNYKCNNKDENASTWHLYCNYKFKCIFKLVHGAMIATAIENLLLFVHAANIRSDSINFYGHS